MTNESKFKKPLLYGLIGSVLVGAALGILFVVRNTWSWFEVQVVLTTVVIAVSSVCGLACDLSRAPRGRNLRPKTGLILSGLSASLMLFGIWASVDSELFWKATVCVSILGVATVHVSMLSIARLAVRFQWLHFVGTQVIFGFALLLCMIIIGEIETEAVWRLVAATSILIAAFTLTIPILHRISKMDRNGSDFRSPLAERSLAAVDDEIRRLEQRMAQLQRVRASLAGTTVDLPTDGSGGCGDEPDSN